MSVIRIDHQKNYVVISKLALEDPNLSFKAKGLWAYCMSRPNDWQFHVSHLATISKDGEDSIYSAIKELEKEGYLQRVQKNEKGKFGSVDYVISEIKIILPQPDFPHTENPRTENPGIPSIDSSPSIENQPTYPSLPKKKEKRSVGSSEYENIKNTLLNMKFKERGQKEPETISEKEVTKLLDDFSIDRIVNAGRYVLKVKSNPKRVADKEIISEKGYFLKAIYKGWR